MGDHDVLETLITIAWNAQNALRGDLAELGIIETRGLGKAASLVAIISQAESHLPSLARKALEPLAAQLHAIQEQIEKIDAEILAWHKQNSISQRLATIPGIGPIIASAIAASVPNAGAFSSARQFAAWVGLVPRQNSTGGKPRLGRISKQGDAYLRRLLIIGAQSVLRWSLSTRQNLWAIALLDRRPPKVAAVALANKMARVAWALISHGEDYRRPATNPA